MDATLERARYRFGFVCAPHGVSLSGAPSTWQRLTVHDLAFCIHGEASFRLLHFVWGSALLIGEAFVAHGSRTLEECVDAIGSGDLELTDALSGRFALFVFADRRVRVFHDPFGSRTVHYTLDGPLVVGSHAALVADVTGEGLWPEMEAYIRSPEYVAKRTRFLPGDRTMFKNIVKLVPNNFLDLGARRTYRYWPRQYLPECSLERYHELFDEYLRRYASYLRMTATPELGLTGGVDSRALIAGLKYHGALLRLVTWDRLPADETRRLGRMIDHLGVPHRFLDVSYKSEDPTFTAMRDAANLNTGYWRGRSFLTAQSAIEAHRSDVFIRGLGGEIMSGYYSSANVRIGEPVVDMMVRHYFTRAVKDPSPESMAFTRRAFEDFCYRGNYDAPLYNAALHDLSYWEHRMGMWGADLNNEFDPAMASHVGMNSRPLYAAAWGLPPGDRRGKELLLNVIRRYDPALADM